MRVRAEETGEGRSRGSAGPSLRRTREEGRDDAIRGGTEVPDGDLRYNAVRSTCAVCDESKVSVDGGAGREWGERRTRKPNPTLLRPSSLVDRVDMHRYLVVLMLWETSIVIYTYI